MLGIQSSWRVTIPALALLTGLAGRADAAAACTSKAEIHDAQSPADVRAYFQAKKMKVVTFFGYSGLGYEDEAAMLARVRTTLGPFDPKTTLVNVGATAEGIGAAYQVARDLGFSTTGIVSSEARREKVVLSPCVEVVFFVTDATWGGYADTTRQRLSPTSQAMVDNSDVLVAIGGGPVSRDELAAALARGRTIGRDVLFFPADMNHANARARAARRGQPAPRSFGGEAAELFVRR